MNDYEVGTTPYFEASFYDQDRNKYDPTTVTAFILRPDGVEDTISVINNPTTGDYNFLYEIVIDGDHTYTFIGETPASSLKEVKSGFFIAIEYDGTDLDYLIPLLRLNLGDWDDPYRYSTDTLRNSLVFSLKALMARWGNRYTISDGTVARGKAAWLYEDSSPPTIQIKDEPPIVLQAAILIVSGATQDASWQVASWRDDEIQVSNIQADKSRHAMLNKWIEMLDSFFKLKLHMGQRQSLPGFRYPENWREG